MRFQAFLLNFKRILQLIISFIYSKTNCGQNLSLIKKTLILSTVASLIAIGLIYVLFYLAYFDNELPKSFPVIEFPMAIVLIFFVSVFLGALIVLFLQFTVFNKINTIENQVKYIAEHNDLDVDISIPGKDEFSLFANHIDNMVKVLKNTYQALQESEYLYKSIIEASADAFAIVDEEMHPEFISENFGRMFGYDLTELQSSDFFKSLNLESLLDSKLPTTVRMGKKDGTVLDLDVLPSPILLKEKSFTLVRFTDITEIKILELKNREHQMQIQQADKLASLGLLVAGVAHEINNPNAFIALNIPYIEKSFVEIFPVLDYYYKSHPEFKIGNLPYDKFKLEIKDLLADLDEGSKRITNIVDELKNFARTEPEDETQPCDVVEIIKSAQRLITPQLKKKNINFNVAIDESKKVLVNKAKLGQVILNILTNAIDAVGKNEGEIKAASYKNDKGDFICSFSDNGIGIPEENLKNIFDPFYTTKAATGGTGLGLSVSLSIMKSMGFELEVKSKFGEGTEVLLIFPKEFIA